MSDFGFCAEGCFFFFSCFADLTLPELPLRPLPRPLLLRAAPISLCPSTPLIPSRRPDPSSPRQRHHLRNDNQFIYSSAARKISALLSVEAAWVSTLSFFQERGNRQARSPQQCQRMSLAFVAKFRETMFCSFAAVFKMARM